MPALTLCLLLAKGLHSPATGCKPSQALACTSGLVESIVEEFALEVASITPTYRIAAISPTANDLHLHRCGGGERVQRPAWQ